MPEMLTVSAAIRFLRKTLDERGDMPVYFCGEYDSPVWDDDLTIVEAHQDEDGLDIPAFVGIHTG